MPQSLAFRDCSQTLQNRLIKMIFAFAASVTFHLMKFSHVTRSSAPATT